MFFKYNLFMMKAILLKGFATLGKSGSTDQAYLEAIARLASLGLRSGIEPGQIIDQLKGITSDPAWDGGTLVRSPADA
ncbi:MAG: hypothetical protein CM1200mP3_10890 [Chloroflexota bacterium]|nr:MAG: hypothetical protein CM1200mP3_10890 [Chloroflexota bacterium]